jgi:hypothetical protein
MAIAIASVWLNSYPLHKLSQRKTAEAPLALADSPVPYFVATQSVGLPHHPQFRRITAAYDFGNGTQKHQLMIAPALGAS